MTNGAPTLWPHLLVEAGPTIAGVGPGDAIAFAPDTELVVRAAWWTGTKNALLVSSSSSGEERPWSEHAWRVLEDPPRLQRTSNESVLGADALAWVDADSDVLELGGWRLRFVLDGPPLATTKRFGAHRAVHARALSGTREHVLSEWLLPEDGARFVLVVREAAGGALTFTKEPRRVGVWLDALAAAARGPTAPTGETGAPRAARPQGLDADVAAGIVAQMADTQPRTYVGFDGVVRAMDGARAEWREGRVLDVYAQLTRGRDAVSDGERAALEAERKAARAASPDQIAAVVRALLPRAWAREQALVEECGVLAG